MRIAAFVTVAVACALLVHVGLVEAQDRRQAQTQQKRNFWIPRLHDIDTETALKQVQEMHKAESLRFHAIVLWELAAQEGDEVLPALLSVYRRPAGEHSNHVRNLTLNYIRARYDESATVSVPGLLQNVDPIPARKMSESDVNAIKRERSRNLRNVDEVWAVFVFSYVLALQDNPELDLELLESVGNRRVPALNRAATLTALVRAECSFARRAMEIMLDEDRWRGSDDALVFENIVWLVAEMYREIHEPGKPVPDQWTGIFERLLKLYEHERALLPRSRRVIPIALQYCFGTERAYPHAVTWRAVFKTGNDPATSGHSVASFMGIEVHGQRIVFVLDMSDSMALPLNEDQAASVREPEAMRRARRDGKYQIDWDNVHTRLDAAREHMKWTLARLDRDQSFAVILFGRDVAWLTSDMGFQPANSSNVEKAMQALDELVPEECLRGIRRHGRLMGETNFYRALHSAFVVGPEGGIADVDESSNRMLRDSGADEIFFLSDGTPNMDGFRGTSLRTAYSSSNTRLPGPGEWRDIPAGRPGERTIRDSETGEERTVY
jgi:hypothetical protein